MPKIRKEITKFAYSYYSIEMETIVIFVLIRILEDDLSVFNKIINVKV